MVTEIARITISPGQEEAYLRAFAAAAPLLMGARGYVDHSLEQCIEDPSRFLLIVHWQTHADHVEGFRGSEAYHRYRAAIAPYQAQPTEILHYQKTER
jgi:heme-degrading monooxygenase HmoA